MSRIVFLLLIIVLALGPLSMNSWGSNLSTGKVAPPFLVESGNHQKLTLEMVRDKIIVLFYESRHSIGKNAQLKDKLTQLYKTQPPSIKKVIYRLVVLDCSEACWPTISIWKNKLIEHSSKEGFTIYGDWNRKMFTDYCLKSKESNLLIIDKKGIIRYSGSGNINDSFEKIKNLLVNLVQES